MLAAVEPALVAGGFGTPELTGSGPEMTQITPRGGACGFNVIGGVGSLLIATYVDAGVAAEQRAAGAPGPPEFLSEVSGLGERAQVELNTDGPSSALTAWRGRERYGVGIATDDVVPPKEVLIAMVTALQALDVATLPLAKLDSFEG